MKAEREKIGARLRFEVLRRCNFACYYCGVPAAFGVRSLHIDHVIPIDLGGTNDPWNLVAACWDCNLGKTNTAPSEELVRQVRDDWAAQPHKGRVGQCDYCRIPVFIEEGDDFYGQCENCNQHMCDSFEAGFDRGYQAGIDRFADYAVRQGWGAE